MPHWGDLIDPLSPNFAHLTEKRHCSFVFFIKKHCKVQVPMVDIAMIDKVCALLDSFVLNNPQQALLEALEYWSRKHHGAERNGL